MNAQNHKAHIEELVTEFCLQDEGDCHARVSLFWADNPKLKREYVTACGEMAARILPVRINRDLTAAAFNEDESETNIEQLTLPGVPPCRLSPLVEVAPGDWRRDIDVSQDDQISHSDRMAEKARRKEMYQKRKGLDQRAAKAVMDSRVPGSSALPRGQVIQLWREIGLFDDEPIATTTHQATT